MSQPSGCFGGDPGVEEHLQQHVTELVTQGVGVVVLQRLVGLVGLFEQVRRQAAVGLLGVPRAAAGRAQPVHDGDGFEQCRAGGRALRSRRR